MTVGTGNYGASPAYEIVKKRRIEGVGSIEVHMNVAMASFKSWRFTAIFWKRRQRRAGPLLELHRAEVSELRNVLEQVDVGFYFTHLNKDDLLAVLLQ
jgi:lipoate-protein ligase A